VSESQKLPAPERLAYNVDEFCRLVGISRGFFYKLPPEQRPREVRRGTRVLISAEAVKEWLRDGVAA
jgi:excisionase family DNA binding protein